MPDQASWLVGVAAVVAVAAAALRWRAVRRRRRPYPGDLWWADVPFADGTGGKFRPCLVLLRRTDGFVVLKITSQDKSHRRDHVAIPTRTWDARARHDSYVNLGEPILVKPAAFKRRAGRCDAAVLRRVAGERRLSRERLARTGRR